jgi:predicted metal-binding membrane protein
MMVAMMLPSLVPTLLRYRHAFGRTGEARLGWLTALALREPPGRGCTLNLSVMAFVTIAITVERLAPGAERAARAFGTVIVGGGIFLIARAAGI